MANPRTFASTSGGRTPRSDSGASGGGGGGGTIAAVDTIARDTTGVRLVDVPTNSLPDGTLVFVRSVRDFFVLDKDSTETSDDITIADGNGGGRWGRRFEPDVQWLTQAEWNIDPAAADDEGDGSAGDPLQTHAELGRRAFNHGWEIRQSVLVNIVESGLPETDPIEIDVAVTDEDVLIRYVGEPTVQQSGTLTDATALVSGTALPTIEDTVGGFGAANVGQRVRLTSGASAGAIAWALRDDGSNTLTTSAFATTNKTAQPVDGSPTLGGPTAGGGDDYVLETLPVISLARVNVSVPVGRSNALVFDSLSVGQSGGFDLAQADRLLVVDGVLAAVNISNASVQFTNVLFRGSSVIAGAADVLAGAVLDGTMLGFNATIQMSDEHTVVGQSLILSDSVAEYVVPGPVSAHDAPGAGLELGPHARMRTTGLIWGSGNGTFGIDAAGGQMLYDAATKPTVTGATNDTQVGGVPTAYADIPAFNGGDGSAIVEIP